MVVVSAVIVTASAAGVARWRTGDPLGERQGDLPLAVLPHPKG